VAAAIAALIMLCAAPALQAARIPFPNEKVSYQLQGETLNGFLTRFFDDLGIAVTISRAVQEEPGTLNGPREGPAATVFKSIADSNGLVAYYDGSVVYIYKGREVSSRYFQIDPAYIDAFKEASVGFGLTDANDSMRIRPETGLVSASGTPRFLDQLTQLSSAMARRAKSASAQEPQPIHRVTLHFIPLKYAFAADTTFGVGSQRTVVPGVATILKQLLGQQDRGGGSGSFSAASVPGLRGRGLAALGDHLNGMQAGPSHSAAAEGAPAPASGYGSTPNASSETPEASSGARQSAFNALLDDGDSPRVVADAGRNALIIRDLPERMPMYESLVRDLDVESLIIQLDATVIDIDTTKERQLGVNWNYQHGNTSASFGGGPPPTDANGNLLGLQVSSIISNASTFIARVNALEQIGITNIVQRPQVVTLNDVEAVIESTQSVYIPVAGAYDEDLFGIDAGTILRVTPHVIVDNGRQRIRLLVTVEDGTLQVTNQPTVGMNGQTLQQAVPSVVNNAVNTQAIIDAGQGLLLGGLTRQQSMHTINKIPLLGSIPLLGHLFRSDTVQREHTQRLFLISPRIVTAMAATLPDPGNP
jgi:type III secretion protein C